VAKVKKLTTDLYCTWTEDKKQRRCQRWLQYPWGSAPCLCQVRGLCGVRGLGKHNNSEQTSLEWKTGRLCSKNV